MEKNTAGDSLIESARGWWWGKEKIEENLYLFFLALALAHSHSNNKTKVTNQPGNS